MRVRRVVPPAQEAVSLQQAKDFLLIDDTSQDSIILLFLRAAIETVEQATNRRFINQQWEQIFSDFSTDICCRYASPASIDTLFYTDVDGDDVEWDIKNLAVLDTTIDPPVVRLAPGVSWPVLGEGADLVRLKMNFGYSNREAFQTSEDGPYAVQCVLNVLGFYFENRQAQELPRGMKQMMGPLIVPFEPILEE